MKILKNLIEGVPYLDLISHSDIAINHIRFDIKMIHKGDLFFAINAYGIDGHQFIEEAIQKGAVGIVCKYLPNEINGKITYLQVENTSDALSLMAANYYDNPTRQLKMIGVTGTNGKTSTVTLLHQLYRKLGHKVGLLSTIANKINDIELPTQKTTPHATEMQRLCQKMVNAGCEYCFMELSSHGIYQRRVTGIQFAGAVFTNITHDHIDYHGSFEEYFNVKKGWLDSIPSTSFVIGNIDDPNTLKMTADVKATFKTLSLKDEKADFYSQILKNKLAGLVIELEQQPIQLQLRAAYNAYNALSVYATAISLGANKKEVIRLLSDLKPVKGRFDFIQSKNDILAVIDYAHTPDAYINLYATLKKLKTQKLISVVGCGGEKDRAKRPKMTKIAYDNSDVLILTSENPRFEAPSQILNDMLSGLSEKANDFIIIWDRKEAIQKAVSIAQSEDIIIITGKGHERYQEIKGIKYDFDEKAIFTECFSEK